MLGFLRELIVLGHIRRMKRGHGAQQDTNSQILGRVGGGRRVIVQSPKSLSWCSRHVDQPQSLEAPMKKYKNAHSYRFAGQKKDYKIYAQLTVMTHEVDPPRDLQRWRKSLK